MRGGDHDQITNRQAPSTSFLSGTRREANDSNIIFDRYKVATKGESECVHLFGGNNRMVGCGVDSKNNSNDDLIYKTRIENEDKSTQIRINETNTQSSNSDIGNKNGYDGWSGGFLGTPATLQLWGGVCDTRSLMGSGRKNK